MREIPMSYYKSLPRKRMGSSVIITNRKGELLVLKTNYKDHWEIPGGVVEENESPAQTARRETLEEIGLKLKIKLCLVVHYRSAQKGRDENITFVFDGGTMDSDIKLNLDKKEITEARFVSFDKAGKLLGKRIASRLPYCAKALRDRKNYYLESIKSIEPVSLS